MLFIHMAGKTGAGYDAKDMLTSKEAPSNTQLLLCLIFLVRSVLTLAFNIIQHAV